MDFYEIQGEYSLGFILFAFEKEMGPYQYFHLSKIICKPGAKFENPIGKFVNWHRVFNIIFLY